MKIYNSVLVYNKLNNDNRRKAPNFKALSPSLKQQMSELGSQKANLALRKLLTFTGLTSLVSWTLSLSNRGLNETESKNLEELNTLLTDKANTYLLEPESMDSYLSVMSKMDNAEANLWTNGLLAESTLDTAEERISSEALDNLLSPQRAEVLLDNMTNKKVESALAQAKVIAASEKYEAIIARLDEKINGLVKEADGLKNDGAKSELYSKIANIFKMNIFVNLMQFLNSKQITKELVELKPIEASTNENKIENSIEEALIEETPLVDSFDETATVKDEETLEEVSAPEIETSEVQNGPKVIGAMELGGDTTRRFPTRKPIAVEEPVSVPAVEKEFKYTEKNKDFIDNIFVKAFKKNSHIRPTLYADQINFIKLIYESYEKENVKDSFLKLLAASNNEKFVEQYKTLTNGNPQPIEFMGFYHLQNLKHIFGGDVTQAEFDKLNQYRKDSIKFWTINAIDKTAALTFEKGVSAQQRLEIIRDFYKIAFNVKDSAMLKANNVLAVTVDAIKEELVQKLLTDIDDYPNIVEFLELQTDDIKAELSKGDKEGAEEVARYALLETPVMNKLNTLVQILNNDAFNGLMASVHARMRFVERFVFDEPTNMDKKVFNIKQITSKKITELKKKIENKRNEIVIKPYHLKKHDGTSAHKSGVSIQIGDITIGINNEAQIHTIYPSDN